MGMLVTWKLTKLDNDVSFGAWFERWLNLLPLDDMPSAHMSATTDAQEGLWQCLVFCELF